MTTVLQATIKETVKGNVTSMIEVENENQGLDVLTPVNSEEDNITLHKKKIYIKDHVSHLYLGT